MKSDFLASPIQTNRHPLTNSLASKMSLTMSPEQYSPESPPKVTVEECYSMIVELKSMVNDLKEIVRSHEETIGKQKKKIRSLSECNKECVEAINEMNEELTKKKQTRPKKDNSEPTVAELRQKAKDLGIKNIGKLKKAELIDAIEKRENNDGSIETREEDDAPKEPTLTELRTRAKEMGIKNTSKMNKKDLCDAMDNFEPGVEMSEADKFYDDLATQVSKDVGIPRDDNKPVATTKKRRAIKSDMTHVRKETKKILDAENSSQPEEGKDVSTPQPEESKNESTPQPEESKDESTPQPEEVKSSELDGLTINELKEYCKAHDIKGYTKHKTRQDLKNFVLENIGVIAKPTIKKQTARKRPATTVPRN